MKVLGRLCCLLPVGLVLLAAGCSSQPPQSAVSVATESISATGTYVAADEGSDTAVSAGEWRAQAMMLGSALEDLEDEVAAGPEPTASTKPDGTFSAIVLSVDATSHTMLVDRTRLHTHYDQARAAAKRDHVDLGEASNYASNRIRERLTLKVAPDAAFVIYYPGEGTPNVSRRAHMGALAFDAFSRQYETGSGTREELVSVGAWITVDEGQVTSLVGLAYD